ncbi:hypothetical protein EW145_g4968 [Phellinidium pouzarii]|uniref:Fe2OG dioxygenase domain-containing protein n=1 Tax=Phellinidium pouzarii TaxID=167371 RepID=A0A4S4L320_9AGAM|nr:hypothetical protein EW145_g4968 [Phellinidium pouzarii]
MPLSTDYDIGLQFGDTPNEAEDWTRMVESPAEECSPSGQVDDSDSDYDSLFDGDEDFEVFSDGAQAGITAVVSSSRRTAPNVPGLFFDPTILISMDLADQLWESCMGAYFRDRDVNQVMLFERARSTDPHARALLATVDDKPNPSLADQLSLVVPIEDRGRDGSTLGLPKYLLDLLDTLDTLLRDTLPPETHTLLFPRDDTSSQARQVILNHYKPGEGISPHVDLLKRYGDGIIGVSLHSGCVMRFARADTDADGGTGSDSTAVQKMNGVLPDKQIAAGTDNTRTTNHEMKNGNGNGPDSEHSVYLPARSIIVMSGEARYEWTHGIAQIKEDIIQDEDGISTESVPRGERLSITYRWLLPGAEIVGG